MRYAIILLALCVTGPVIWWRRLDRFQWDLHPGMFDSRFFFEPRKDVDLQALPGRCLVMTELDERFLFKSLTAEGHVCLHLNWFGSLVAGEKELPQIVLPVNAIWQITPCADVMVQDPMAPRDVWWQIGWLAVPTRDLFDRAVRDGSLVNNFGESALNSFWDQSPTDEPLLEVRDCRTYRVVAPWWSPAMVAVTPLVWFVLRFLRLRRRRLLGLCRVCGYDLRTSPGRCSECGSPLLPHCATSSPPPLPTMR